MQSKNIKDSRIWWKIDAHGQTLGRVASKVAVLLMGKHKPTFVPYLDSGDCVAVINYKDIVLTGNKSEAKTYYHHSGYPGGLKAETVASLKRVGRGDIVLRRAIYGMLPKNQLRDSMIKRLRIFNEKQENLDVKFKDINNGKG